MLGSIVLEVAIGLVFFYLSLSMISSALTEYYSAILARRAKHLRNSLFFLFNKDDPKGISFLLDLYQHPLINGLSPRLGQTAPRTSVPDLPMDLPWFQKVVVVPAQRVADGIGLVAASFEIIAGAFGWVTRAVRDPYGVGGLTDTLHRELRQAAKATPTYIPDRIFSEAIFAVLKDNRSALRRLRIAMSNQISQLQVSFQGLKHPDSVALLRSQLQVMAPRVEVYSADSEDIFIAMQQCDKELNELEALLPDPDPSHQPALDLIARQTSPATAPDPNVPPANSVSEVAETVRVRLAYEVGTLPDGPSKRELSRLVGERTIVGQVSSLYRTRSSTEEYLKWLGNGLDTSNKARLDAREAAIRSIAVARQAVKAAGPAQPDKTRIRDHVFKTLGHSLQRLRAGVGTLHDGLRDPLKTQLSMADASLETFKTGDSNGELSLDSLQDEADRIFAGLRGTLDGLRNHLDSSKVVDWVNREAQAIVTAKASLLNIAKLRDAVNALPDSQVKSALTALADEADDDLDRVKRNIEAWFNDSMDRVGGLYKRNTQIIIAVISILLVVGLNADSLGFAGRLWGDHNFRNQVVIDAENGAKKEHSGSATLVPDLNPSTGGSTPQSLRQTIDSVQSQFPLGWTQEEASKLGISGAFLSDISRIDYHKPFDYQKLVEYLTSLRAGLSRIASRVFLTNNGLRKLAGLAITVIAVSMGAPFWFDILNKFVNVRSAGLKPRKSEDEPSDGRVDTAVLIPAKH